MNFVYQNDNSIETGNCMSACVASVLGLHIEEVPNFHHKKINTMTAQLKNVRKFLKQFDLTIISIVANPKNYWQVEPEMLFIAGVVSPNRDDCCHAVIGKFNSRDRFIQVFDPNPEASPARPAKHKDLLSIHFIIDINIGDRPYGI